MKSNKLNISIIIGLFAIIGILIAQILWTKQAFSAEEKKFSQKAHIALLEVAKKLYQGVNHELPAENPVKKIANDYYIINVDNDFEPKILEFYLRTEFSKSNIQTDFEYAIYNCQSDEMVYGGYVAMANDNSKKSKVYFPKHKNLVYYFAIRFPNQNSFLLESLSFWVVLSAVLVLILLLYCYSIYTLLQQKKYADLQRDFVNNMTHEFKTPLSSILIASQFLKTQPEISSNEKSSKYNQIIIDQGHKLNSHIEKILNLSKSDLQPLQLELETIDILTLINRATDSIHIQYNDTNILVDNSSKLEKILIKLDSFHFINLLYNLIENGIKYNDQKPEIKILLTQKNHQLWIEIIDNGIGIGNEDKSKVFNKFVRLQKTENSTIKGFGLGLFYVKNICKQHKWQISVHDNKPFGSNFRIIIPFIE